VTHGSATASSKAPLLPTRNCLSHEHESLAVTHYQLPSSTFPLVLCPLSPRPLLPRADRPAAAAAPASLVWGSGGGGGAAGGRAAAARSAGRLSGGVVGPGGVGGALIGRATAGPGRCMRGRAEEWRKARLVCTLPPVSSTTHLQCLINYECAVCAEWRVQTGSCGWHRRGRRR